MEKMWIYLGIVLVVCGALIMFSSNQITGSVIAAGETTESNTLLYIVGFVILIVGILIEIESRKKHFFAKV